MLGLPAASPYDLRFRLVGVPVRVSWTFWLTSILLLGIGRGVNPREALLWVGSVFVSILLHEFGHALTAKLFGFRPQVVLFGLGGLCASEAERQTFGQRLAVLIMGPGAQFLLLAALIALSGPLLGLTLGANRQLAGMFLGIPVPGDEDSIRLMLALGRQDSVKGELYWNLFQINWLWPLINLLPIWPLDGGQITGELLGRANPREGKRWGHIVSMVTAGLLAFYLVAQMKGEAGGRWFTVIFFGFFAFVNYQVLQAYHQRRLMYGPDQDADWWTRQ